MRIFGYSSHIKFILLLQTALEKIIRNLIKINLIQNCTLLSERLIPALIVKIAINMNENYGKILEECKIVIEQEYAPCGLEDEIKKRLLELAKEWEKRKKRADEEGRTIGGLRIIVRDVFRAVGQAESNMKRFEKPKCYYLRRGLQIPYDESGGLGYLSLRFW